MDSGENCTSAMDLRSSTTINRKVAELRNARETLVSKKYDSLKIATEVGRKYQNVVLAENAQGLSDQTSKDRDLLMTKIREHQDLIEICQTRIAECNDKIEEYNLLPNSSKLVLVRQIMKDKAHMEKGMIENALIELEDKLGVYKIRIENCNRLTEILKSGESLEDTCVRLKGAAHQVGIEIKVAADEVNSLEKELCPSDSLLW